MVFEEDIEGVEVEWVGGVVLVVCVVVVLYVVG